MAVNSVTEKEDLLGGRRATGWLALNGCTNFGGRTFVSVPSGACSSEATGQSAGMVGLLESTPRDAGVEPHRDLRRYRGAGTNVLSANEVMQIVRSTADDIDFSTPNAVDPANNFGTSDRRPRSTPCATRPRPGWDATFGYGRINATRCCKAVQAGRIPPEADITGPSWFDVLPASGTLTVDGRVAAVRAESYDYRVEWAPGLQPPPYPGVDTWHRRRGTHEPARAASRGRSPASTSPQIAAALPDGGAGAPVDPATGKPDEERFSGASARRRHRARRRGDGLTGVAQKQVFVHDDPDLVGGLPATGRRARRPRSPVFADLDGRPGDELILATDDGVVHAYTRDGREHPGLAGADDRRAVVAHGFARRRSSRRIAVPGAAIGTGAPIVADLDGDGQKRGRRHRRRRQHLGVAGERASPFGIHADRGRGSRAFGDARRLRVLTRQHRDPGRVQPHEARVR